MKKTQLLLVILISIFLTSLIFASSYSSSTGIYQGEDISLSIVLDDIYGFNAQNDMIHSANTRFEISSEDGYLISADGTYIVIEDEKYDFVSSYNSEELYFQTSNEISLQSHYHNAELHYIVCEEDNYEECTEEYVSLHFYQEGLVNPNFGHGELTIEEVEEIEESGE